MYYNILYACLDEYSKVRNAWYYVSTLTIFKNLEIPRCKVEDSLYYN